MKCLAAICVKKIMCSHSLPLEVLPSLCVDFLLTIYAMQGARPLQTAPSNILPIAKAVQSIPYELTSDLTNRERIKAGKKSVLSPCLLSIYEAVWR